MPRQKQLSHIIGGKIEALHFVGHTTRQIAVQVGRSKTTVHQCLQRLSNGSSDYANVLLEKKNSRTSGQDVEAPCH